MKTNGVSCARALTAAFLSASCLALGHAYGQTLPAGEQPPAARTSIFFTLDSARFVSRPQVRLGTPFVTVVLDVRVTNQSAETYWYDALPEGTEVFPTPALASTANSYRLSGSVDGTTWTDRGEETYSRVPTRTDLSPGESVGVSFRYEAGNPRGRYRFVRLGVEFGTAEKAHTAMLWSDSIDTSPARILDLLAVKPQIFAPQAPNAFIITDKGLQREAEDVPVEIQKQRNIIDVLLTAASEQPETAIVRRSDHDTPAPVVELSEQQYVEFRCRRERITLELFASPDINIQDMSGGPAVSICMPTRSIHLPEKQFRAYRLTGQQANEIGRALEAFPEFSSLHFALNSDVKEIPTSLVDGAGRLPALSRLAFHTESSVPVWTSDLLAKIGRLAPLRHLSLSGDLSDDEAFGQLAQLKTLESISLRGTFSPRCFQTLAKLPRLTRIAITGQPEFAAEPIDDATSKAIASLNGRPMRLGMYRGYYHPSFVRSMMQIKTAKEFVLWTHTKGNTAEDMAGLDMMTELEKLEIQFLADEALQASLQEKLSIAAREAQAKAARHRRAVQSEHSEQQADIPNSISGQQVGQWLRTMSTEGGRFDPRPVLAHGDRGLRALLQRIFPEALPTSQAASLEAGESLGWIAKSDGDSLLAPQSKFLAAWKRYLDSLTEYSSDEMIAEVIVRALQCRVDRTDRKHILRACFDPLLKSRDDKLYQKFIPLLNHPDVEVPIFVLTSIGGRAGNDYVTPIHKAAIESERTDLIKAGVSNLPAPMWDQTYRPKMRKWLVDIFSQPAEEMPFRDDPRFLISLASSGSRHYEIPAARKFLVANARSSDSKMASLSLSLLCDVDYLRQPMEPELKETCQLALQSNDVEIRRMAASVLGTYMGTDETISLLLQTLRDSERQVWQTAANGLLRQTEWAKETPTPIDLVSQLTELLQNETSEQLKQRYSMVIKVVEKKADFDWVEWELTP